MTKQELRAFKKHISKELGIGSDSSCIYTFLPDDIQEAGESCFTVRTTACACGRNCDCRAALKSSHNVYSLPGRILTSHT